MRGAAFFTAMALLVGACTTDPIPPGYRGPVAYIADSQAVRSSTGVDFFYISRVNGNRVNNSLAATQSANAGRGFAMTPAMIGRPVPAETATFTIVGRTHYAAPIIELVNKVYQVSGETKFTPLPNRAYVVKGILRDDYAAVWIEDGQTGELAGNKIEIHGSTTLGILEK